MALHVGLDIRKYFDYGIGTYIQELIRELQEDDSLRFTYFVTPAHKNKLSATLKGTLVEESSGLYSLGELFKLSSTVKKARVDVFHEPHYTFPFFLSVPGVATIHDIIHLRLKEHFSPLQRCYAYTVLQHACKAARAIIVNAGFTKHDLLNSIKVPEEKVHVVYVGVAQAFLEHESEEYKEEFKKRFRLTKPYILYVGALKPHKNIPVLLTAYAHSRYKRECDLVLVGEAPERYPQIANLAAALGLENHLKTLGKISQRDLRCAYQCASMLVFPSLYEGFGSPLVEAMASGIPIIGARSTVIPEILGDAGLLFEPTDAFELAEKIDILLSDVELQKVLRDKGTQQVKKFSYTQCARETKKIYQTIAGEND